MSHSTDVVAERRHLVVSTHFDDAVLSVADLLLTAGAAVTVATACAGRPGEAVHGDWDDASGFASAREAWEARKAEDLEACARTGARSVHLDELDRQHVDGDGSGIDGERLRARVAHLAAAEELLWLPAAIGRHRDHSAVRDALLPLLAAHPGGGVIYADSPYAGQAGWDVDDAERPARARWEPELAAIGEHVRLSERRDIRLDAQRFRAKLELVRCHRSQLGPLSEAYPEFLRRGGLLATEVRWDVPAAP